MLSIAATAAVCPAAEPQLRVGGVCTADGNYGPSKRAAVSRFFAAHLGLDLARVTGPDGTIDESFVTILDAPALSVFDAAHPRPAHAVQRCDEVRALLDRAAP